MSNLTSFYTTIIPLCGDLVKARGRREQDVGHGMGISFLMARMAQMAQMAQRLPLRRQVRAAGHEGTDGIGL